MNTWIMRFSRGEKFARVRLRRPIILRAVHPDAFLNAWHCPKVELHRVKISMHLIRSRPDVC
jgi:hypothetical protein